MSPLSVMVLNGAAVALGVMYLVTAIVRWLASRKIGHLRKLQRMYRMSVLLCFGLSINSFRILWTGTVSSLWSIYGLSLALVAVYIVYLMPALEVLKLPPPLPIPPSDVQ